MFTEKTYKEIVDDIISQITKGIVREEHEFMEGKRYKLLHSPVKEIVKVEGMFKGNKKIFKKDVDYRQNEDIVEWLNKDMPDNSTPFFVSYVFNEPSGITDVNVGSVTRTLVEAISREISFLYEKLGQVYLSGFIDTAYGSALDLVVSILGIERMPPTHATGIVTLGRNSEPKKIDVKDEQILYKGDDEYELKNTVCEIMKIEGIVNNLQHVFKRDEYVLTKNKIKFIKKPDINTNFYVTYTAYEYIKIPVGTRVSTYSTKRENARIFETMEEKVLENKGGQWSANVQAKAVEPGKYGNVYANTITVMPKPVPGVEYVTNKEDIFNGLPAESDEKLRNRAKKSLEIAGKATILSLKSAIESVEGVKCVVVEEIPDVPGIVKAIVSGGREEIILKKIEETRAAGVKVEFIRPKIVYVDISSEVEIGDTSSEDEIVRNIKNSIVEYVSSLGIGESVLYNKVVSAILSVEGVVDVLNLTLNDKKENVPVKTDEDAEIRDREIKAKK